MGAAAVVAFVGLRAGVQQESEGMEDAPSLAT
jgi:hypothetical protein